MPANGTSPAKQTRVEPAGAPRWEAALFAVLVVAQLVPLWAFRYLPTQDGPLHVMNALILKDYGTPGTRYHEFFQLRREPFPNWTTEVLLAALLAVFPPLFAEKVLASLYVVGLSYSLRYFLGAFGPATRQLAPVGLLLLFNRCFLMGFYNYVLSLVFLFLILGYCQRRRHAFGLTETAVLLLLGWLAYFTHLLGYALAAAGAFWLMLTAPRPRAGKVLAVALAFLPTAWLAAGSLLRPGFLGLREATGSGGVLKTLVGNRGPADLFTELAAINQHLFGTYEGPSVPLGLLVLALYVVLLRAALLNAPPPAEQGEDGPPRWPIALFALGVAALYVLLPDSFSLPIGFLKARLILLPPLLGLACVRFPIRGRGGPLLTATTGVLVAVNLVLLTRHVEAVNRDLADFTAGVEQVGRNRILFTVAPPSDHWHVAPLVHAADYYCLTTGNVNLDNFQATVKHFPVGFRPGVERAQGDLSHYRHRDAVEVVLVWDGRPALSPEVRSSYRTVYQRGRLLLLEKRVEPHSFQHSD